MFNLFCSADVCKYQVYILILSCMFYRIRKKMILFNVYDKN